MALSEFLCLIHQHHRNTFPDRIAESTGRADEAGFARFRHQCSLALGTDENCNEIR